MKTIFKRFTAVPCARIMIYAVTVSPVSAEETYTELILSSGKTIEEVQHILNIIGCVLPIITIIYFEMYQFWGC